MSLDREPTDDAVVTSVEDLLETFRLAERRADARLIGLEHEKFIFRTDSEVPVPYEGGRGIGALLAGLEREGYASFREGDTAPPIALTRGRETISLEPGGQFELSGSPFRTAREAHAENLRHASELRAAAARLGLVPVALGYRPFGAPADVSWMPKTRYQMMRKSLPTRGGLALDMMLMTCTGQVSLDWSDEADCARKMTLAARISPLLVALFANSPIVAGKPSGYLSYRSHVWTDVDPTRCGFFPAMLDGSFGYRAYVDWALQAPLLFLRRDGRYVQPRITFAELLARGWEGRPALASDWTDHLSTLFPEVRIKTVLEIRAADCVSLELTGGLLALMRGLLYDPAAFGEAERLLPRLKFDAHLAFQDLARREGLKGVFRGVRIAEWATQLLEIARGGLRRLDAADAPLLDPLAAVAKAGRSPAEDVLAAFAADARPASLWPRFAL